MNDTEKLVNLVITKWKEKSKYKDNRIEFKMQDNGNPSWRCGICNTN